MERGDVLFLVRTHYVDEDVFALLNRMRAGGYDVALLMDAEGDLAAAGDWPVVPVSRAAVEALSLFAPDDFAWRCGDYGLYLAQAAFPQKTHFWMIEPDVLVHAGDMPAFFDSVLAVDAALLAGWLEPARRKWYWYRSIAAAGLEPWRLLYSLVRLRADALALMLEQRRRMSDGWLGPRDRTDRRWPNDEALTASLLMRAGLPCIDFNALDGAPWYDRADYGFHRPLSRGRIEARVPDGRLYHPVLGGERYLAKVERLVREADARHALGALRFFDVQVEADLALEAGADAARAMAQRVRRARARALVRLPLRLIGRR